MIVCLLLMRCTKKGLISVVSCSHRHQQFSAKKPREGLIAQIG
jgi:hypothetical protein